MQIKRPMMVRARAIEVKIVTVLFHALISWVKLVRLLVLMSLHSLLGVMGILL